MAFLDRVEIFGNCLPHPAALFIALCVLIPPLSWLCAVLGLSAVHPVSGEVITAVNLVSVAGLHRVLTEAVANFIHFAPVGIVLVAILGFGIAEESGLLSAALRWLVLRTPSVLLSFSVVLAGIVSSLAADVGYVVLIPLAGALFAAARRHPVTGIAAAFAGVSAGFSANLVIGPLDPLLSGISTTAMQLLVADYEVSAAANYYFMLASTPFVALLGAWVTERVVAPRLGEYRPDETEVPASATLEDHRLSDAERRGLRRTGWFSLVFAALIATSLWPADGILRSADGGIAQSPFVKGLVVIITLYAGLAGWLFGRVSGRFTRKRGAIVGMETGMRTMASYIVLMFFAAQAVNYFGWTNLGLISAVHSAEWLRSLDLPGGGVLIAFAVLAAVINLLIGSASAKWALLAPIFIPMFYLVGISPDATQAAYRIGDSTTNILTPLMPYFALVAAFMQRYDRRAGIGTLLAVMLPYSLVIGVGWLALFGVWLVFDLPLGF